MKVIKLIHNKDCHIWQVAKKLLEESLEELSLPKKYEVITINTDEEAEKYKFFGSPQILVNGKDIDPLASGIKKFQIFGCRAYFYKGKFSEYPSKEMILSALKGGENNG